MCTLTVTVGVYEDSFSLDRKCKVAIYGKDPATSRLLEPSREFTKVHPLKIPCWTFNSNSEMKKNYIYIYIAKNQNRRDKLQIQYIVMIRVQGLLS